jgi:methylmalonyl-CoA mutase N-terminal domain/subunit
MQREIVESAYRHQQQVESKEKIVVGLNQYATEDKTPIKTLRVNPAVEKKQIGQIAALRRRRNNEKVKAVLDRLHHASEHGENLMPVMIEAVESYATLGEICDVLRDVYGVYRAPTVF